MNTTHIVLEAAPAMGIVLVTWLVWAAIFIGLGLTVLRLAGDRTVSADRLIGAFWSGMAVAIGFLQVWHLFWRVNLAAAVVVGVSGIAGLAWAWGAVARWASADRGRPGFAPGVLLAVGVAVWMADRALALPGGTDSAGYHLQAVRWAHTFAATPGLANLHHRLGFNNANHLLVAMMGSGPWESQGSHVAPGMFVLGLFASGVLALVGAWGRCPVRGRDVFDLFLLPAAFLMAVGGDVTSPSSDLPAAAVTLAGASALFAFLQTRVDAPDPPDAPPTENGAAMRRHGADVVVITLLLSLAVCIKLSAAVFAAAAWLVMGVAWALAARRAGRRPWGRLAWSIGLGVALMGPWCARSVMLSGYPFFPSSGFAVNVPWKSPPALVDYARLSIISWARQPGRPVAPSTDWRWVDDRWREFTFANPMSVLYPLVFAAVAGAAVLILMILKKVSGTIKRAQDAEKVPDTFFLVLGTWLLLPWLAAVIVWFLGAPALRFAWQLFFIPPAIGAALLLESLTLRGWARAARWALGIICLALVLRVYDPLFFRPLLVTPGTAHGFEPTPVPTLSVFVTRSGLRVYHPAVGECWDGPLPCSPELRPELRLRRDADLASGFTLGDPPKSR